jgi:predicted transcriptional regulator
MFTGIWGVRRRRAARDPLAGALGVLERECMEVIWRGGALAVRDVQAQLARPGAYTTVMTTLDRLFKKGFVTRTREGRAFVYTAARTRAQVEATLAAGVLTGLLSSGSGAALPVLSNLVEAVSEEEGGHELLDRLEALVRAQRRRLDGRGPAR